MKLKRFEVEEDDAEVTETISLHEVYRNLDEWKESIEKELNSQYGKGCLIPIKAKELKELAEKTGSKKNQDATDKAGGSPKEKGK